MIYYIIWLLLYSCIYNFKAIIRAVSGFHLHKIPWKDLEIGPTIPWIDLGIGPTIPWIDLEIGPTIPWIDPGIGPTIPWIDLGIGPNVPWIDLGIGPNVPWIDLGIGPQYPRLLSVELVHVQNPELNHVQCTCKLCTL